MWKCYIHFYKHLHSTEISAHWSTQTISQLIPCMEKMAAPRCTYRSFASYISEIHHLVKILTFYHCTTIIPICFNELCAYLTIPYQQFNSFTRFPFHIHNKKVNRKSQDAFLVKFFLENCS